jgi:hypothetical protein
MVHHEMSPTASLSFLVYALAIGRNGGVRNVCSVGDRRDRGSGASALRSDAARLTLSAASRS